MFTVPNSHPESRWLGTVVLASFRPKPGRDSAVHARVSEVWKLFDRYGLVTPVPPRLFLNEEPSGTFTFVLLFSFKEVSGSIAALEIPEIVDHFVKLYADLEPRGDLLPMEFPHVREITDL